MNDFFLATSVWVPCYGLIGALLTLPWATGVIRRTGPRPAAYFNLLMTVLSLVHSSILLNASWNKPPRSITIPWLQAADLNLSFSLEISQVSTGATVVVTGLTLLALIYALGSMEMDWAMARFYALMGFFECAMSGLALSDSLFLSYALLEMLTLSTYLLVGFWYAQPLVVTAARDAFWTKRVGDLILLMGVVALSTLAGSLNFSSLADWAQTANLSPSVAALLGLALIAGPTGKCAQFPLHLWLDEAMEGPNPASVLRNSVVVACGAYLLINLQPVLALSPITSIALCVLGAMTAVGASLVALAQIDLKRALSHSTSAYMGLVFLAVGLNQPEIALLFLFTHAIAKALLFMSTGAVIMTTFTQDLTEMGGLGARMPVTTTAYVVGAAGLVALVPLGSFWSMLRWADSVGSVSLWLVAVLLLVNGLTAFNLTRVFGLVFAGPPKPKTRRAPEVAWPVALPLVTLTVITLLVPVMLAQWQQLPLSTLNWPVLGLLVASSGLGCVVGAALYLNPAVPKPVAAWAPLQNLLAYDFYIERLYRLSVVLWVNQGSRLTSWIDHYLVDGLVNLVGLVSIFSGESLKYTSSGRSQLYLLVVFLGVVMLGALVGWSF
ncbi:NAD(P)H-quinone oxidoreductase subunit F [Leptolyngbya sp. FACHB-261]|uniref:NAD(P)H-quinone oxidoreductase subunit F n=1 Tax=Leptolyngbya sp. FACHB-261 TaxID=2692806 RepID=UPI0016861E94|nr:NAD(P)H-quinone oxidoreductase subunit F [Leptolyngbya sp. FACHB-261]MBD2100457.1 NAD(P)H-quinone oxidoreductase subunit F [Leptolyngbya sp. FACHB-261]